METLQARFSSFSKSSKRTKAPLAKSTSNAWKWPHPPSFKAKPSTLAEAGFYFTPSVKSRDCVTCFICGKELSNWESDDDPFEVHWTKCGRKCAWAIVRCGLKEDMDESGNFVFPNSTRLPSSKLLERARLETFTVHDGWPHDDTRGHGASSKKMAKAGFVYTPEEDGDDTASCFYCGISLSGWKEDDDPLEEHRKREEKKGELCPFFPRAKPTAAPLGRSTSKVPSSRGGSRPPTRSTSRTAKIQPIPDEVEESINVLSSEESDLTSLAPSTVKSKARSSVRSKASASKTTVTPATNGTTNTGSKRSTRGGTSGSRKTPASQDATGSEFEEQQQQVEGSGSEAGKRVSKSKKGISRAKNHIAVIVEEEDEEGRKDVPDAEEEVVEVVIKPKRGRPPGSKKGGATAAASSGKAKKTPVVQPEPNVVVGDSDLDVAPAPKRSRTKAKASPESESDVPKASSSKPVNPRSAKSATSTAKSKTRAIVESDDELAEFPAPPSGKGSQKKKVDGPALTNGGTEKPPSKGGRTVSRSKAKAKRIESESDSESLPAVIPKPKVIPASSDSEADEPPPARLAPQGKPKTGKTPTPTTTMLTPPTEEEVNRAKGRKSSNTSDDAGYATAENVMDVDEEPPAPTIRLVTKPSPTIEVSPPATHGDRDSGLAESVGDPAPPATRPKVSPAPSTISKPASTASYTPASTTSRASASRTASVRLSSRPGRRETTNKEIVDVSSDDDEPSVARPPSSAARSIKVPKVETSDPIQTDTPLPPSSSSIVSALHSDLPSSRAKQEQEIIQDEVEKAPAPPDPVPASIVSANKRSSAKSKGKDKMVVEVLIPISAGKRVSKSKRSLDIDMVVDDDAQTKQTSKAKVPQITVDMDEDDHMNDVSTPPRTPVLPLIPEITPSTPPMSKDNVLPGSPPFDSSASPDSFIPFLGNVAIHKLTSLTEEEYSMTIEQYIRREMERQYQQFKEDGERRIEEFKRKAAETRKILEAS